MHLASCSCFWQETTSHKTHSPHSSFKKSGLASTKRIVRRSRSRESILILGHTTVVSSHPQQSVIPHVSDFEHVNKVTDGLVQNTCHLAERASVAGSHNMFASICIPSVCWCLKWNVNLLVGKVEKEWFARISFVKHAFSFGHVKIHGVIPNCVSGNGLVPPEIQTKCIAPSWNAKLLRHPPLPRRLR